MPISRPCYATRQDVRQALDVKQAAFNDFQIDRQIVMGSDSVDELCKRWFYPLDAVWKKDWPNFQYAYPWRVYFDNWGLISYTQLNSGGVVIPSNAVILHPVNEGPPYTWLELNRSLNYNFGNGPTPQNEIQITGTWGWWLNQFAAATLTASINSSQTTLQVSIGGNIGVGDTLFIDSERLLVTDKVFVTTGQTQQGTDCSTASAADNQLAVGTGNGSSYSVGDVLLLDAEWMRVLAINGDILIVKRAWDGSVLSVHANATIYANRLLTVLRGALGTTAATHAQNAPVGVLVIPGLIKELALAEAIVGLIQEPGGYASNVTLTWHGSQGTTGGQQKEAIPGPGLPDLRDRCVLQFGRVARSRVV